VSGGGSSGGGHGSGSGGSSASGGRSGSSGSSSGGNSTANGSGGSSTSKGPSAGVIAGGVVGGVAVLALIVALVYFLVRSAHKRKAAGAYQQTPQQPPASDMANVNGGAAGAYTASGEPELHGSPVNGGPGSGLPPHSGSPSPEALKAGLMKTNSVSPVSPPMSMYQPPTQPMHPELMGQAVPYPSPGGGGHSPGSGHPQQQQQVYEFPQQNALYEAGATPAQGHRPQGVASAGGNGMGWQSGPVQTSYEMDGGQQHGQR
jgi:hypothetical protein